MRSISLLFSSLAALMLCSSTGCFSMQPESPQPEASVSVAEEAAPVPPPSVYAPPADGLSPQELVQAYFDQTYQSYCSFVDIDLTAILDTRMPEIRSSIAWSELLNQRRRLLSEMGLCYVETQTYPYTIRFIEPEQLDDDRLSFWDVEELTREGEILIHFVIEGQDGCVYPPQFAVNAQHTMRLYDEDGDGEWKIIFHYFPGAIRKYNPSGEMPSYSDAEMQTMLQEELSAVSSAETAGNLSAALPYDPQAAVTYANTYTEKANPAYYRISDWMGNCSNFTSQCISMGFGGTQTATWYAGSGGGSLAWENVGQFWTYAISGTDFAYQLPGSIANVQPGDLLQTASATVMDEDGNLHFNHSLMVVDAETLLLAQNSPGCFIYYSDLVNVTTRLIRPVGIITE